MACRMLVAVGQFPVARLLDSFKLMVLNRNQIHELNENNCNFIHGDGWGIVIGRSGKIEEFYKKAVPCWKDPRFLEYYNIKPDFVIVHARKASKGTPVNCSCTHPFERENWYFCQNGTVTQLKSKEKSDSEQFFALLLANIRQNNDVKEGIKNTIKQMKEYTALNFILANCNKSYILIKYQKYPKYYTMKYLKNENYVIVSSEALPNFHGEWTKIVNNNLVVLDVVGHQVEVHQLF